MIKAAYIDGETGLLYFQRANIVYRTLKSFKEFLNPKGPIRYEGEVWGLAPSGQPYSVNEKNAYDLAELVEHPKECVMDVNATIESLKVEVLDRGIIEAMRERKGLPLTKK